MDYFTLSVKILPNSSQNAIVEWENEYLKIRIQAPPEKGKANKALIAFLAKTLSLPKSQITLLKGETSRLKILRIEGFSKEDFLAKISELV